MPLTNNQSLTSWPNEDRIETTSVANLIHGSGSDERQNGTTFLSANPIFDDDEKHVLTGSAGCYWFCFDTQKDRTTDLKFRSVPTTWTSLCRSALSKRRSGVESLAELGKGADTITTKHPFPLVPKLEPGNEASVDARSGVATE